MKLGKMKSSVKLTSHLDARAGISEGFKPRGRWYMVCHRKSEELWREPWKNVIVNSAVKHMLNQAIGTGETHITGWYIGLIVTGGTVASGDALESHAGWTEMTAYTGVSRPKWQPDAVSGKTIDNSTNKGTFSISASTSVGGAFMCSQISAGVESATETMWAAGMLGTERTGLQDGDTLTVQATFSGDDDGA